MGFFLRIRAGRPALAPHWGAIVFDIWCKEAVVSETMKAIRMHGYGGSEVLTYDDVPRPEPGPGEALVRVRAASVNPADWKMREGYMRQWVDPPLPISLGSDLAGDVVALGTGATGVDVGDAVFGMVPPGQGAYAEYVAVPSADLVAKPAALDYAQAAAVPLAGLAAWQSLIEAGGLARGQTVLIHGAAGGVGGFAVQIARAHGAYVIATASGANHDYLSALGADQVIDYTTTRFEDTVQDVDLVLDTIGGDTQERSWQVLKPGGVLVSLVIPPSQESAAAHGARGVMVGTRPDAGQLRQLAALIETGQIRPEVTQVWPMAEVRAAQDQSQGGHTRGKIVLGVS